MNALERLSKRACKQYDSLMAEEYLPDEMREVMHMAVSFGVRVAYNALKKDELSPPRFLNPKLEAALKRFDEALANLEEGLVKKVQEGEPKLH